MYYLFKTVNCLGKHSAEEYIQNPKCHSQWENGGKKPFSLNRKKNKIKQFCFVGLFTEENCASNNKLTKIFSFFFERNLKFYKSKCVQRFGSIQVLFSKNRWSEKWISKNVEKCLMWTRQSKIRFCFQFVFVLFWKKKQKKKLSKKEWKMEDSIEIRLNKQIKNNEIKIEIYDLEKMQYIFFFINFGCFNNFR